jgi:integrase
VRGTIVKRRSLFYGVVSIKDPQTGERKRQWLGGFPRRRDAERAITEVLDSIDRSAYVPPTKQTLEQYLTGEWLPAIKATIRPSTWDSYRRNIENHILPRIGSVVLSKVTAPNLNAFYAGLLETGRKDRRGGLSAKTVRYIHTTLHRAFRDAVRWGKLSRNPANLADPPKQRATRTAEINAWSAEEARGFLAYCRDDRLAACYLLALTTGMRRGELLGLRWADIDLDGGHLSIRQTVVSVGYEVRLSEPKTDRSRRTLAIDPATVAALRAHHDRQAQERAAWGPAWVETGLVFTRENGEGVHPQLLSDAFDRHVKASGLRRVRFHDLRHTYATLALDSGMKPWDLSDRLGHSSVAFTLNVYRHAIKATQDQAAAAAAVFILGESARG